MLFLYPKNTIDFTNNGDPIHHSYDEHVVRDDGFYLAFNLLLDKEEDYKKVKKEMIISADTPDGKNQFRVYDVKKKNTHVEITAVQLMYDFDNKEVNPFSLKNASGTQIISRFKNSFKSSLGQFTMDSSVTETHDFSTNDEDDDTPSHNALEILNRITDCWDSELMLNGFDIRMIKRLGAKTDALLYEKKNISEFEDSSSVSGMATRIHATSKFTPEGKENEVTLSVTVDSPLINEYAQVYEKSYVNNDCRTEAELIAWAKLKYSTENIDKPSRSITVSTNIIDGTKINYGDDLVLKYLVHDVDEVIRCVGYDYDPIRNTYYSVTLGDWKDSFATTLTGGIVDTTNRQINQLKNNITYISMSANGKNRTAYGPEPVPNPINGDMWYYYESDRPNDVELRIFKDGFWDPINFATKKEVEGALAEAEEAKQEAINSYNNALTDAKNYTEVKAQEFDNQMIIVNQDLVIAKQSADTAVTKANQAVVDAGFAKVDAAAATQLFYDMSPRIETAFNNANLALGDAGEAYWNAEQALGKAVALETTTGNLSTKYDALTQTVSLKADKQVVDTLKGTVDKHTLDISANATAVGLKADKTLVDTINGTVGTHTTQIKAAADGLLLKADSETVNTIKGTVETHTTQIKAASDGLALKADKTAVDAINGTVTTHASQIKANSDGLALKASATLVNTIKGTVDQHSLDLTAQAGQIAARLTSAQVDSLINGKGYATTAALTATSSSLTTLITGVETDLAILEIGGRNYFSPTKAAPHAPYMDLLERTDTGAKLKFKSGYVTLNNPNHVPDANVYYTFSGYLKVNEEIPSVNPLNGNYASTYGSSGSGYTYDSVTGHFSVTQKISNGANWFFHTPSKLVAGDIIEFIGLKLEKGNKATDWTPAPEDMTTKVEFTEVFQTVNSITTRVGNSEGKISALEINVNGLQSTVVDKADKSQITQLSTQIQTKVESATYNSKMTQLDNLINLRVEKANIITQINLSAESSTVLIQGKRIQLDGNVAMNAAFISRLDTQTLTAVTANIATIRGQILIANVVTATHVKADNAMIDNLFATTALVERLTAKTAFINSIKAIDIAADRITTGTLNASNVMIINLDASEISTGTLSGIAITSPFNYIYTGTTRNIGTTMLHNGEITMHGSFTNSYGSTYLKLNADGVYGENLMANGSVRSLFKVNGDGITVVQGADMAYYRQDGLHFNTGSNSAYIRYYSANARIEMGSYNGVTLGTNQTGTLYTRLSVGGGADGVDPFVDVYTKLNMRDNPIENVAHMYTRFIRLTNQGSTISGSKIGNTNDNWLEMGGKWGTRLGHLSDDNATIYERIRIPASGNVVFYTGINMNGNTIVNQSDRRLKRNINNATINSLEAISRWNFVTYEWVKVDSEGKKGVHLGLISQDTPELLLYDSENDVYNINSSKQTMMNSHAIQQVARKVCSIETIAQASNALAGQALSETALLKLRVEELEQKIKQLESVA